MVSVDDVLRSHTLLLCLDGNRNTVLVRAADEKNILPAKPLIPHIYVSRHIDSGEMTNVNGTIRVRERTGHQLSSVILVFHIYISLYINKIALFSELRRK